MHWQIENPMNFSISEYRKHLTPAHFAASFVGHYSAVWIVNPVFRFHDFGDQVYLETLRLVSLQEEVQTDWQKKMEYFTWILGRNCHLSRDSPQTLDGDFEIVEKTFLNSLQFCYSHPCTDGTFHCIASSYTDNQAFIRG